MRSKKFLIFYAVVIFVIVFLITFNSICAIKQVDVKFNVSSQVAKEQSVELQKEMNGFLNKNFLFFKSGEIKKIFDREENSHFKLLSVEKNFPNKVVVKVTEMYESYAFYDSVNQRYIVTDTNGEVIVFKDDVKNNLNGNNVDIKGFSFNLVNVGDSISAVDSESMYFKGVKSALSYFNAAFGGVRTNIVSVEFNLQKGTALFQTQEGVQFYFTDMSKYSNALFEKVSDVYRNSLSDGEKTYGRIAAFIKDDNKPEVQYVPNLTPQ